MDSSYMDPYCYNPVPGTDVPLDHMDFGYVSNCSDSVELSEILKILRSGKEGHYPELLMHTEERLRVVDPSNKLLIRSQNAQRTSDLPQDEYTAINKDLKDWTEKMQSSSQSESDGNHDDDKVLPPVRKVTFKDQVAPSQPSDNKPKADRIKSYDFDGWSKFDVEKEATKVDIEEPQPSPTATEKPHIPLELTEKENALSGPEKQRMADKEREKGNEAFRAGDLEEAYSYYSRSINFNPSVAAYNNRALTEIKLKKYQAALEDCTNALKIEPSNTKALFRRGTAYSQLHKPHQAATDFERVLHFEPNNKKAQQELNVVRKTLDKNGSQKNDKKTGRRIQIEEVNDSEDKVKTTPLTDTIPPSNIVNTSPPSVAVDTPPKVKEELFPLPSSLQALKDEGNQLFRAGQYVSALEKYTSVIVELRSEDKSQSGHLSTLLSNRAACQLKIGNCEACIIDCTESLHFTVCNVKALMRRAKAYELLEKYKQAYNDYQMALSLDRSLAQAYEASSRIISILQDEYGLNWRDQLPPCPEAVRMKAELQPAPSTPSQSEGISEEPSLPSHTDDIAKEEYNSQAEENENTSTTAETTDHPSLPESVSSDSSSPSVVELSDDMTSEPTVTSEPINVTAQISQTKVTQSTDSVSSPRTTTTSKPKTKSVRLSPEEKFEKHKLKGNEHLKKGEFVEALRYYNFCVNLCPGNVVGYTNRALCHLKLNSPRTVESDCSTALSIEPNNIKALYRRGLARKAMTRYADSVKDFHLLLSLDPENQLAKKELGETKQLWEQQLRSMQARSVTKETRTERRSKNRKKKDKNAPPAAGPKKQPTKEEMERFQKLLKDLEASKEKIEALSKDGPKWGGHDGPGGLPFTGPPPPGKSPPERKSPTEEKSPKSSQKGAKVTGNPPKKAKKKVPKKPPMKKPESKDASKVPDLATTSVKGKRIVIEELENSSDDEVATPPGSATPPEPATPPTLPEDVSPTLNKDTPPTPNEDIPPTLSEGTPTEGTPIKIVTPPTLTTSSATVKENGSTGSPSPLRTPFEFVQRWNAISRSAQSSDYSQLLETIPPASLPGMITTKLDGNMLTNIIRAIDEQFVPKGKYQQCVDILTHLSKVPRFGMVSMFMGTQEKSDLSRVLSALSTADVPSDNIEQIKKLYSLQ